MSDTEPTTRRRDPSTKWMIGGAVVASGGFTLLLMFLASQMRWVGAIEAAALGAIGVTATAAFGTLALGPVGRAIGRRIMGEGASPAGELEHEVEELRLQLDDLRHALSETQERIDFAERLLVRGESPDSDALH